jgi:hypothetical protein
VTIRRNVRAEIMDFLQQLRIRREAQKNQDNNKMFLGMSPEGACLLPR